MANFIDLQAAGVAVVLKELNDIHETLQNTKDGLTASVNAVAGVFEENFNREGTYAGKWRDLADRTKRERKRLGFGESHPILRRDGTLMSQAVAFFLEAEGDGSSSGDGAGADLHVSNNLAVMHVSGRKVENQYGNAGHNLPARQFWFTTGRVGNAARDALEQWLQGELS